MSPDAHASFEVATIKPSDPNSQRQGIDSKGRTLILLGQTLTNMMVFAYQLHKDQIVGGPAWISTDRYDIEGVPDTPGDPDLSQIQEMVRTLLADRFRLTFHHEQREMTYYAIVLAKGGSKLAKSAASDDNMPHQSLGGNARQKNAKFTNNQMSDFALCMQLLADRPVIDATGLKGRFDFTLAWQPNDVPSTDPDVPPPLFTAVEEQLGLKLQPKKGPIDALVIDKVTRPTAN